MLIYNQLKILSRYLEYLCIFLSDYSSLKLFQKIKKSQVSAIVIKARYEYSSFFFWDAYLKSGFSGFCLLHRCQEQHSLFSHICLVLQPSGSASWPVPFLLWGTVLFHTGTRGFPPPPFFFFSIINKKTLSSTSIEFVELFLSKTCKIFVLQPTNSLKLPLYKTNIGSDFIVIFIVTSVSKHSFVYYSISILRAPVNVQSTVHKKVKAQMNWRN